MDSTWTVVKPSPLHPWGAAILKDGILHGEMGEELADYIVSLQAQLAAREAEVAEAIAIMTEWQNIDGTIAVAENRTLRADLRTLALSSKDAYVVLEALRVSVRWELAPEIRAEIARVAHGLALALAVAQVSSEVHNTTLRR